MDFLLILVEIMMVNNCCNILTECLTIPLSSFAVRTPQTVERALRKVTGFTRVLRRFLQSCTCYHGKSKEAESFSIVERRPYVRYSIVITCVYIQTSIHRAPFISCVLKALHEPRFNPDAVPISITFIPKHTLANSHCFPTVGADN